MSVRIHVTASLANQDAIRSAFRELPGGSFDNINIEVTPPWSFFTTSVWGVESSRLVEGLQRTGHVGLLATTSDASRWFLTLICPGQPPLVFLHEFHLFRSPGDPDQTVERPEPEEIDPRLVFLEPDPEPGLQREWCQFDFIADEYAAMGVPIDESFRDRVQGLTYGAALIEFQRYETARLADCLAGAGLEFDRRELLDALLWKSTTEREAGADIGNLPGVLLALGLRGSIADFFNPQMDANTCRDPDSDKEAGLDDFGYGDTDDDFDEGESDEEQQEIEEVEARIRKMQRQANRSRRRRRRRTSPDPDVVKWGQDTFLSATRNAARTRPLTPVGGGGVDMDIEELPLLDFFAQAVSAGEYPPAVISITLPPGIRADDRSVSRPVCTDIEVRPSDGVWLVGARSLDILATTEGNGDEDDFLVSCLGKDLANVLRRPPDGTGLQVDFAAAAQPEVCLRFSGLIVEGRWHIAESYPTLDRMTFESALLLARQQEADEYVLSSGEEAEAILQAAGRDGYLYNMGVTRQGNRVCCEHDGMGYVARLILRHRFGHIWNFAPALRHIDETWRERRKLEGEMRREVARMRRDCSPPFDRAQVIFRGATSVYWAADMTAWQVLDPKPRIRFDSALKEAGFAFLGDFVCKKVRNYVQRCFISADRHSYALLLAGSSGYLGYEFVSHFENSAQLTTSTSWMAQNYPEIEVYAQYCPNLEPRALFERHIWGIGRFHTHKQAAPVRLDPSLAGLCNLFDRMLARMSAVESRLFSFETIGLDAAAEN